MSTNKAKAVSATTVFLEDLTLWSDITNDSIKEAIVSSILWIRSGLEGG
jgi:hypothetical protein